MKSKTVPIIALMTAFWIELANPVYVYATEPVDTADEILPSEMSELDTIGEAENVNELVSESSDEDNTVKESSEEIIETSPNVIDASELNYETNIPQAEKEDTYNADQFGSDVTYSSIGENQNVIFKFKDAYPDSKVRRFEMFYFSGMEPSLSMITDDGTKYSIQNRTFEDNRYIVTKNFTDAEKNLQCKVIYFNNFDTKTWTLSLNPVTTKEDKPLVFVQTEVPNEWETSGVEYACAVAGDVLYSHIPQNYEYNAGEIVKPSKEGTDSKYAVEKESTPVAEMPLTGWEALVASMGMRNLMLLCALFAIIISAVVFMIINNKKLKSTPKDKIDLIRKRQENEERDRQRMLDFAESLSAKYLDIEEDKPKGLVPLEYIDRDGMHPEIQYVTEERKKNAAELLADRLSRILKESSTRNLGSDKHQGSNI